MKNEILVEQADRLVRDLLSSNQKVLDADSPLRFALGAPTQEAAIAIFNARVQVACALIGMNTVNSLEEAIDRAAGRVP